MREIAHAHTSTCATSLMRVPLLFMTLVVWGIETKKMKEEQKHEK